METDFERIKPVTIRPLMAKWAVESWGKVKTDTVYNSWRHQPWSYFPDEPTRAVEFEDDDFDYSSSSNEEEDTPTDNNADVLAV